MYTFHHDVIFISNWLFQPDKPLTSGHCIRISTGAALPLGADAVIQVEDTELLKASDDGSTELQIKLLTEPKVGQDIRYDQPMLECILPTVILPLARTGKNNNFLKCSNF